MGILEEGQYIEVHPTFLYESIVTILIFTITLKLSKNRKYKGQITLIYLILYSFARSIIEGLRIDSLMLGSFRISQVLSIIIFMISISIYKKMQFVRGCKRCRGHRPRRPEIYTTQLKSKHKVETIQK